MISWRVRLCRSITRLAALFVGAAGCRTPATEVLIAIGTDIPASQEMTLRATVRAGGDVHSGGVAIWTRSAAGVGLSLPATFAVTPGAARNDSTVTLDLEAVLAAQAIGEAPRTLHRIVRFSFTPHLTTQIPLFLALSCTNLVSGCTSVSADLCTESAFCQERGQTCGDRGTCTPIETVPQPIDGGVSFPDVPSAPVDAMDATDAVTDAPDDPTPADVRADDAAPDVVDAGPPPTAPRPTMPPSTSIVSTHRPTFRWVLAPGSDGANVEICADRACTRPLTSFDGTGTSARPPTGLAPGAWFWRLRGRSGARQGPASSTVWQFWVQVLDAPTDETWGSILDVNGDGLADVLGGAHDANMSAGGAALYLGTRVSSTTPSVQLHGSGAAGGYFGEQLAAAGDINGDGFADAIVGESAVGATTGTGALWVFYGGTDGLAMSRSTVITGPDPEHGLFGRGLGSGGDIDEDGYADIVVGAPSAHARDGRAYVYFGGPSGIDTLAPRAFAGGPTGGQFGTTAAGADVNGDGHTDLLVSAAAENRLYIYPGDGTRVGLGAMMPRIIEPVDYGFFPNAVSVAGDVNGDGYPDIVGGAPNHLSMTGIVYVYCGGVGGPSTTPCQTLSATGGTGGYFGWSVAIAGDLDGDGFDDIAAGAPGDGGGRITVFRGGSTPSRVATWSWRAGGSADELGRAVARAGDVNGDGFPDLLVGAPGVGGYVGQIYIHAGTGTGIPLAPSITFNAPATCCRNGFGYGAAGTR